MNPPHPSPPTDPRSTAVNYLAPGAIAAIVAGGDVSKCTVIFNLAPSGEYTMSTVVEHAQYLALLTGADRYLHPVTERDRRSKTDQPQRRDRLEFRPPGSGARILETLESGKHVLITGPAGSGKTRLCIEAAQAAHDAGWHVSHITGPVPFEQLVAKVKESGDRNALFVFGQPEKNLGFDPHTLVEYIRLETNSDASRTIGILAASPTGAATAQSPGDTRFEPVRVPVDSGHTNAVIKAIIDRAGWPRRFQGDMLEAAKSVCGDRPGLAVRIAPELALDPNGKPTGVRRSARKSGTELSRWIGRSLTADGLATGDDTDEQSLRSVGAAVALMAAPQTRERVQQAVESVLNRSDEPSDGEAVLVVDRLLSRGWLVECDGELEPLHAVVTDQLLARVLLTSEGESLSRASDWIFQAALESPLACRRLIEAVRRLVVDHPHPNLAPLLETRCRAWVQANRERLGSLALEYEREFPGEPGLIADMLSERPWRAIALNHLESLSWGLFSGAEGAAAYRNRLLRCLEALGKSDLPEDWDTLALNLVSGDLSEDEGALLHVVLERSGPEHKLARQFREQALAWSERNAGAESAAEVLGLLLRDRSMSYKDGQWLIERGLAWLARHGGESASHVLAALINRPGLNWRQRKEMWRLLRFWLSRHGRALNAKFVLRAMLAKPERRLDDYIEALPYALEWFEANGDDSAAWSVSVLLCARAAMPSWWPVLLPWLETRTNDPKISSVLTQALLKCPQSAALHKKRQLVRCALTWVRANAQHRAVPEVGKALAGFGRSPEFKGQARKFRSNLAITIDQADAIVEAPAAWMEQFGTEHVSSKTVSALLGYFHARKAAQTRFVAQAVAWFDHPRGAADSEIVLAKLARRGGLTGELAEGIVACAEKTVTAFPWIARNEQVQAGIFIIFDKFPATTREALRDKLIDAALRDPEGFPDFEVLLYLLALPGLDPDDRAIAVECALRWIERNSRSRDADKLIRKVFDEQGLTDYQISTLIDHAFEWLEWWIGLEDPPAEHEGPATVLTRLLACPDLNDEDAAVAFDLAVKWRSRDGGEKSTAHRRTAEALLAMDGLTPEQSAKCLSTVLYEYRPGNEEQDEARRVAIERAVAWLDSHTELPCASRVLSPTLWKVLWEHDIEWDRAAVVRAAANWIQRFAHYGPAGYVLEPLLKLDREGILPPEFPDLRPLALAFLEAHDDRWYSARIYPKLCKRSDLSDGQRAQIVDIAAVWFAGRASDREASRVLYGLSRLALGDDQREFLVEACLSWARNMIAVIGDMYAKGVTGYEEHLKPWDPRFVLRKVLARTDLDSSQCARVLGIALRTHRVKGLRNTGFDWSRRPEPEMEIESDLEPDLEMAKATDEATKVAPDIEPDADADAETELESEPGPEPEAGDQPLLRLALEHLAALDDVVEVGPILAEAQTFKSLEPEQRALIRDRSLVWLERHADAEEAGEVCVQLARQMPAPPLDDAVVQRSITWLGTHADRPSTGALIGFLMSRPLSEGHLRLLLPFAERALADYEFTEIDSRLLSGVVSQPLVSAESAQPHVQTAIDTLRAEGTVGVAAENLLEGLSRCRRLDPGQRRQVVDLVVKRASQPKSSTRAGVLIIRCLGMEDIDGSERDFLFGAAVAWADGHIANDTAWSNIAMLGAFAGSAEGLGDTQIRRAAKLMVAVSREAARSLKGAAFFVRVLRFQWIEEPEAGEIRGVALDWLQKHCRSSEKVAAVLLALWPLQSSREGWVGLARLATMWLRDHDRSPNAGELVRTIRGSDVFPTLPTRVRSILEQFEGAGVDPVVERERFGV